MYALIPVYS